MPTFGEVHYLILPFVIELGSAKNGLTKCWHAVLRPDERALTAAWLSILMQTGCGIDRPALLISSSARSMPVSSASYTVCWLVGPKCKWRDWWT